MKKMLSVMMVAALLAGCATSFSGSAKVEGPAECQKICAKWDMVLAGMVALGEYTNGCVCRVKEDKLSLQDIGQSLLLSSAGVGGGAAGVYMQMQDDKK